MKNHFSQRLLVGFAGIGIAVVASACGTASPPESSTSTTTTLPNPVKVLDTSPTGAAGFEGSVFRIAVAPLGRGVTTLPVPPGTQRVEPGTIKIAYRQFGSGPDLVLAMGEHGSMTWWDPQFLQQLSANYRVTIFDFPEVGYSASMTRAPSVQTDGDVMAGLIASLGLTNVTVLGWGMGGEAALSFAERHSGLAIGLVLVDTTAGGGEAVRPNSAVSSIFSSETATMAELSMEMFPTQASVARTKWLSDISAVAPDDVVSSTVSQQAKSEGAFFVDDRVARSLSSIAMPTMIVTGEDDQVIPQQNSQFLLHSISHARLVVLKGAGYASLFQDSSTFVADLSTFLNGVSTSTTTTTNP